MEVLELLRKKRGISAEAIGAELGITANAVRQHLTNLEREGLVRSQAQRNPRGRPSLLFSLTEQADSYFPKRYGQLATMVLTEVQEMGGPEALDQIFQRIAQRHAAHLAPSLEGLTFEKKLAQVVNWIARAGTLADYEEGPDGVVVSIHNCPFRNTALRFPQVCTITPHLLSGLLGLPVSQNRSIHRRDTHCSFVIQRPPTTSAD